MGENVVCREQQELEKRLAGRSAAVGERWVCPMSSPDTLHVASLLQMLQIDDDEVGALSIRGDQEVADFRDVTRWLHNLPA